MFDGDVAIAVGQDEFESIADQEFVFYIDLGETALIVKGGDFTDELLTLHDGFALQVILIVLIRVTLIKAFGVAAVGQSFQFFIKILFFFLYLLFLVFKDNITF